MTRAADMDILELPGIRSVVAVLRQRSPGGMRLIFANTAVRREAKALLFAELAEAVKQKMPLDLALSLSFQTVRESQKTQSGKRTGGAHDRQSWQILVGVFMYLTTFLAFIMYTALAFRGADIERVAQLLAMGLRKHVAEGLPLSLAMRRCPIDFDPTEIAVVEAGEKWDTVAFALEQLSEFQVTENRLTAQGAQAIYPVLSGTFFLAMAAFFDTVLMPKYRDMFDQLGAELPFLTQAMFHSVGPMRDLLLCVVAPVATVVITFLVLRALMNGSLASVGFVFVPLAFIPGVYIMVAGLLIGRSNDLPWLPMVTVPLGLVLAAFWVLAAAGLMKAIEWLILFIERHLGRLLRYVPLVGGAQRTEAEARWLAALCVGLESRLPLPEALVMAGDVCGGSMRVRSRRAAQLAAAGVAVGDACVRAGVLRRRINYQLMLVDWQGDFVSGLKAVSDDASQQAFDNLNRTGRITEIFATVVVTVFAFVILVSVYLPMFSIPKLILYLGVR